MIFYWKSYPICLQGGHFSGPLNAFFGPASTTQVLHLFENLQAELRSCAAVQLRSCEPMKASLSRTCLRRPKKTNDIIPKRPIIVRPGMIGMIKKNTNSHLKSSKLKKSPNSKQTSSKNLNSRAYQTVLFYATLSTNLSPSLGQARLGFLPTSAAKRLLRPASGGFQRLVPNELSKTL